MPKRNNRPQPARRRGLMASLLTLLLAPPGSQRYSGDRRMESRHPEARRMSRRHRRRAHAQRIQSIEPSRKAQKSRSEHFRETREQIAVPSIHEQLEESVAAPFAEMNQGTLIDLDPELEAFLKELHASLEKRRKPSVAKRAPAIEEALAAPETTASSERTKRKASLSGRFANILGLARHAPKAPKKEKAIAMPPVSDAEAAATALSDAMDEALTAPAVAQTQDMPERKKRSPSVFGSLWSRMAGRSGRAKKGKTEEAGAPILLSSDQPAENLPSVDTAPHVSPVATEATAASAAVTPGTSVSAVAPAETVAPTKEKKPLFGGVFARLRGTPKEKAGTLLPAPSATPPAAAHISPFAGFRSLFQKKEKKSAPQTDFTVEKALFGMEPTLPAAPKHQSLFARFRRTKKHTESPVAPVGDEQGGVAPAGATTPHPRASFFARFRRKKSESPTPASAGSASAPATPQESMLTDPTLQSSADLMLRERKEMAGQDGNWADAARKEVTEADVAKAKQGLEKNAAPSALEEATWASQTETQPTFFGADSPFAAAPKPKKRGFFQQITSAFGDRFGPARPRSAAPQQVAPQQGLSQPVAHRRRSFLGRLFRGGPATPASQFEVLTSDAGQPAAEPAAAPPAPARRRKVSKRAAKGAAEPEAPAAPNVGKLITDLREADDNAQAKDAIQESLQDTVSQNLSTQIKSLKEEPKPGATAPTIDAAKVEEKVERHISKSKQKTSGFQEFLGAVKYLGLGKERSNIIRNLATMLDAGLPLIDSLHTLQKESRAKPVKKMIQKVVDAVENGSALWRAMENQHFFSPHAISLIRIGEEAGNLAENLQNLAAQEEKDDALKGKIKMAMIYPSIVIVLMFIIVMGLGLFVLPNLLGVLTSLHAELPLVTRLLIGFTNWFQKYAAVVVPGTIGGMLFIIILAKFTRMKVFFQWIMFKVPGIGRLAREATIARFGIILGSLLQAGVPLLEALNSLAEVTPIVAYRKLYFKLVEHVNVGDSFSKSFESIRGSDKLLPVTVQQLVTTGERSGSLAKILVKISEIYEKKANETAEKLPVILEPMILLFIGGLVGMIAFAIIIPIYSVVGSVSKQ